VTNNYGLTYRFTDFTERWLEAAWKHGYPTGDHNYFVFSTEQSNINQHGRHVSTDGSFLVPILKRSNIYLQMFAKVRRILVETTSNGQKRAKGVEYEQDDRIRTVRAKREVILGAGAISSSAILMRSGVGPLKVNLNTKFCR